MSSGISKISICWNLYANLYQISLNKTYKIEEKVTNLDDRRKLDAFANIIFSWIKSCAYSLISWLSVTFDAEYNFLQNFKRPL